MFTITLVSYNADPSYATLSEKNVGGTNNEYAKNLESEIFDMKSEPDSPYSIVRTSTANVADQTSSNTTNESKDFDTAKGKARDLLNFIFNSLFPETREKFSNSDYGVDMEFPKNWTGFEMKVILPMAVVSPEGINIKDILSTITESSVDSVAQSIVSEGRTELSQEKKQELTESGSKKLMESIQNKTSTMGILIYDKEFAKLINSMNPNSTTSADSLTSIYENLAASDSTISCDRKTLEQITLNNNMTAEKSTEQCLYPANNKKQDNLNYLVLTPNAIVGIQYTSDPNKENDKFLSEFEQALKTLSIKESLPINNQTIQQFLSG